MAYTASTIAATTTPAATFSDALKPLLIAGGLTFVETWTSGNITAEIYQSTAAANGYADWYFMLYRATDAATSLNGAVAESWDTATKKLNFSPPQLGSRVPDASFRYDSGGVLPSAGNTWNTYATITGGTAGFSYWLSVNPQRVVLATRVSTTDYGTYWGLYDDLAPADMQMMPLVQGVLTSNNPNAGNVHSTAPSCTREPGQTIANGGNFVGAFRSSYTQITNNDAYLGGAYTTSRVALQSNRNDKSLGVRGLLKDVIVTTHSGVVNGDNLIVTMQDGSTKDYFRARSFWCDKAA